MIVIPSVFETRAAFSCARLDEFRASIKDLDELKSIKDLTIFGAGSYARHEASKYSDIDMFFYAWKTGKSRLIRAPKN